MQSVVKFKEWLHDWEQINGRLPAEIRDYMEQAFKAGFTNGWNDGWEEGEMVGFDKGRLEEDH